MAPPGEVYRYHDGTKHHFNRFARSVGYLDWASQPDPFRHFAGAPAVPLRHAVPAGAYDAVSAALVGDLLRHALGLSAWKSYHGTRWSLRVNPSSGNLHPTEAYLVTGAASGLGEHGAVWHYAPDRHALERRCAVQGTQRAQRAEGAADTDLDDRFLIALTSVHWREAWKYGERAFRYCQHDLGHAVAAIRIAAALAGWRARLLPSWSHAEIAALTGIDRDADYVDAEREEPACVLLVARDGEAAEPARDALLAAVRAGTWTGRASQLSGDHVQWTFIDEIARATVDHGHPEAERGRASAEGGEMPRDRRAGVGPRDPVSNAGPTSESPAKSAPRYSRRLVLQRRSALGFDGVSRTDAATMDRMLSRVLPASAAVPWDLPWWSPRIHLALFVHRVDGLDPGLYLLPRDAAAVPRLRAAMRPEFLWEPSSEAIPLWRLARGDARDLAQRLSCDQDIASDGFFSLGMIADVDRSLDEFGPSFYRHLFWESGIVGQVLYLEAEAAGARATGIGCFYDDPVHAVLGLEGHAFQSLYHFTVGMPVEDARLTTEPGYGWESAPASGPISSTPRPTVRTPPPPAVD